MKKRSLKKISLGKSVISSLQENKKIVGVFGGRAGRPIEGTSPKCGISEYESCHGSCNLEN